MDGMTELCGVCGAPLRRAGARFCGGCGAEQGLMVARDAGAGRAVHEPRQRERYGEGGGLTAALGSFFALVALQMWLLATDTAVLEAIRIFEMAVVVVGIGGVLIWRRHNLRLLGVPATSWRGAGLAVASVGLLLVFVHAVAAAFPSWFLDETLFHKIHDTGPLMALVDLAVLPAIGEEIVFRGVILTGLLGVFRERTAIVVSALLFATVHLSPVSFVHLTALGAILAVVRIRSGSIWPAVALHCGYNATIVLIAW